MSTLFYEVYSRMSTAEGWGVMTQLERRGDVSESRAGAGGSPAMECWHKGCDGGAETFQAFSGDPSLLSAHLRQSFYLSPADELFPQDFSKCANRSPLQTGWFPAALHQPTTLAFNSPFSNHPNTGNKQWVRKWKAELAKKRKKEQLS